MRRLTTVSLTTSDGLATDEWRAINRDRDGAAPRAMVPVANVYSAAKRPLASNASTLHVRNPMRARPSVRASLSAASGPPACGARPDVAEERLLCARLGAGDEHAFERLFRAYYPGLRAFAARIVRSEDAAEDLVADVFVRLWEQRTERIGQLHGSAGAYLYQAVRNAALNSLRHAKVEARWRMRVAARDDAAVAVDEWAADASSRVVGRDLMAAVNEAMTCLPERCREVYMLSRRHGLGYEEIARVMGISPNTVKVQMGNALRLLRRHLSPFLAVVLYLVT